MFGWINDCTECMIVSKFGEENWHRIKAKGDCDIADRGFLRYKYYPDSVTVQLVVAASEVLGISVDDVLFAFGDYFIDYVQDNGYSNVLEVRSLFQPADAICCSRKVLLILAFWYRSVWGAI